MNKLTIALSLCMTMTACDSDFKKSSTSSDRTIDEVQVQQQEKTFVATSPLYSHDPTKYSWPPADEDVTIAQDLMTTNYYLIVDGSGSMSNRQCSGSATKLEAAKVALTQFIGSLPQNNNVGLLTFDSSGIHEKTPLGQNRSDVITSINSMSPGSVTPLFTSIKKGYNALTDQAKKQLGYGEYHLVIVTDGEASNGEDPTPIVTKILYETPIIIHTIGFCIHSGHSLNVPGKTDYRAANNPEELLQKLTEVLAESPEYDIDTFK